ncbi:hypothetical protein [Haloferula sp. A504]|uniref:hypothetical protein n=1 Tax=Haloferula sp. A504 TaxID=3373601 RepID=UPI0031BF6917|nr:hypothetical protein [Verrucomicrobiaceae bacterium E54]
MQLTRFDRWLREKFVHEIHVYSLRPPEIVPKGVRAEDLPETPGRKFRHRYVAHSSQAADALIGSLKEHNQMFTTRVVDRKAWYVPLCAPKDNKSVTWWCAWVLLSCVGAFVVTNALRALFANPTFRDNIAEALEIMKG